MTEQRILQQIKDTENSCATMVIASLTGSARLEGMVAGFDRAKQDILSELENHHVNVVPDDFGSEE